MLKTLLVRLFKNIVKSIVIRPVNKSLITRKISGG
jgi:hypothetical protein